MSVWPDDQMSIWPEVQKARYLGYKYKSWNIGVALAMGPRNPSKDTPV